MIKDYELRMNYISSYMLGDKLVIPYGLSPSDMGDEETTTEAYLAKHARRYGNGEPLKINLDILNDDGQKASYRAERFLTLQEWRQKQLERLLNETTLY
jgi:hypothetical protein